MAEFLPAVTLTLQHEGGFVDNPNDSGGATNMGIEQRDLPNIPIKDLTQAQAIAYYRENYWKSFMGGINSQMVCSKLFDMGVLLGVQTAVRLIQRALGFPLSGQDGVFGPTTEMRTNAAYDSLLPAYKQVLVNHFDWVVSQDSSQQVFLTGWINRVNS